MPARVVVFSCAFMLTMTGCSQAPSASANASPLAGRSDIDRALARAADFLLAHQSADGAWRSEKYGAFKDGGSLTPPVLFALLQMPPGADRTQACRKGLGYLIGLVGPDGGIDEGPHGLSYPVYTASMAVMVLSRQTDASARRAQQGWLNYLRARQLTESLGWTPADRQYGGWGFSSSLPRKPAPGQEPPPLTESNLSATVFALEALRAVGATPSESAVAKALTFVERCQNFRLSAPLADDRFNDGGFFFIYDDPVRNKAGAAGQDSTGALRFISYGSMTADGLRALLLCGLPLDYPRVLAARKWLFTHFRADGHPGDYVKGRDANRDAVYYYYCFSLARALGALGVSDKPWTFSLAKALIDRQRPDGSWENPIVAVREDDPLVATFLAASALAECRRQR
jgi:squalene-hopene/tetraprenyl-beta-curcumene cyclase